MKKSPCLIIKILLAMTIMLLPMASSAEFINVYPGPDAEWNYLYDYGDVEVGTSAVMAFEIENDVIAESDLFVENVFLENTTGPFSIEESSGIPGFVEPGESVYVTVAFTPNFEDFFEETLRIHSNASNDPPGQDISYALQGMGVPFTPDPDGLIAATIQFYQAGVTNGTIYGLGPGKSNVAHQRVFSRWLYAAEELILADDYEGACDQLNHIVTKCDGVSPAPDFIGGSDVPSLYSMIKDVMDALGCDG